MDVITAGTCSECVSDPEERDCEQDSVVMFLNGVYNELRSTDAMFTIR